MSQQAPESDVAAPADGPEIVSEFPAPPVFFVLYRDGADCGPPPPEPMAPTYHMFGTPYSTQDVVPDLLPQEGRKLYLNASRADGAAVRSDQASVSSASDSDSASGSGAVGSSKDDASAQAATDATLDENRIDYKAQMKKCVSLSLCITCCA